MVNCLGRSLCEYFQADIQVLYVLYLERSKTKEKKMKYTNFLSIALTSMKSNSGGIFLNDMIPERSYHFGRQKQDESQN